MPHVDSTQFNIYLAGFLDGDGSIYVRAKPNSTYRFGYQVAPTIAFFQSISCIPFPALCKKLGYGTMRVRKDGIYEYTISRQADIHDLLQRVSPYLELKKAQAALMIEILELKQSVKTEKDFERLLAKIDIFRDLNYSKKRKVRTMTP
jgi:hypothetical protein